MSGKAKTALPFLAMLFASVALTPPALAVIPLAPPPPANCTIVPVTWATGLILFNVAGKTPVQTMRTNQMYAFKLPTPIPAGQGAKVGGVAYTNVSVQLSISTNPCEWTDEQVAKNCATQGPEPSLFASTLGEPDICPLVAGETYYYNVRNATSWNGPDSCPEGQACNYYFFW